jgi:ubiquinone/menaquinone biosynthesis C-methylase UbiE
MEDFQNNWYQDYYNKINVTATERSIFSKFLHWSLEMRHKSNRALSILEVGSHTGEHVKYVKDDWKISGSYLATDIRSLNSDELSNLLSRGVDFENQDVESLTFQDNQFDRVISTCLFHHLINPFKGFQEVRRVTKVGGKIDILLPNDPGLMYRFLRKQTSLRKANKMNLKNTAEFVHALEHRNHYLALSVLAAKVFEGDLIKAIGFPFYADLYNLNAFTVLRITKQ